MARRPRLSHFALDPPYRKRAGHQCRYWKQNQSAQFVKVSQKIFLVVAAAVLLNTPVIVYLDFGTHRLGSVSAAQGCLSVLHYRDRIWILVLHDQFYPNTQKEIVLKHDNQVLQASNSDRRLGKVLIKE